MEMECGCRSLYVAQASLFISVIHLGRIGQHTLGGKSPSDNVIGGNFYAAGLIDRDWFGRVVGHSCQYIGRSIDFDAFQFGHVGPELFCCRIFCMALCGSLAGDHRDFTFAIVVSSVGGRRSIWFSKALEGKFPIFLAYLAIWNGDVGLDIVARLGSDRTPGHTASVDRKFV